MENHNEWQEPGMGRWAVILAGGDGARLLSLTRQIHGEDRPKQFAAVAGMETLLEQTRRRIASFVSANRTAYSLTRTHARFYQGQLAGTPSWSRFEQPSNRGTAHGILFSLLRVQRLDPHAVVAFIPSDHYISNNDAFLRELRITFEAAEAQRGCIVLLGVEATSPERSYGWIEPGAPCGSSFRVNRFWEKPGPITAALLHKRGCLWNSFVMAGTIGAFLSAIDAALPDLLKAFRAIEDSLGTGSESAALEALYRATEPANFSMDVLSARPENLLVTRARGLGWSDLGEPARVHAALAAAAVRQDAGIETLPSALSCRGEDHAQACR